MSKVFQFVVALCVVAKKMYAPALKFLTVYDFVNMKKSDDFLTLTYFSSLDRHLPWTQSWTTTFTEQEHGLLTFYFTHVRPLWMIESASNKRKWTERDQTLPDTPKRRNAAKRGETHEPLTLVFDLYDELAPCFFLNRGGSNVFNVVEVLDFYLDNGIKASRERLLADPQSEDAQSRVYRSVMVAVNRNLKKKPQRRKQRQRLSLEIRRRSIRRLAKCLQRLVIRSTRWR